jgi:pilus assembly protein Flp/PilA
MLSAVSKFLCEESGQDMIDYAIAASLIALGAITGLKSSQTAIKNAYTSIAASITTNV